jgi:hypothetical protein
VSPHAGQLGGAPQVGSRRPLAAVATRALRRKRFGLRDVWTLRWADARPGPVGGAGLIGRLTTWRQPGSFTKPRRGHQSLPRCAPPAPRRLGGKPTIQSNYAFMYYCVSTEIRKV